MSEEDFQNPTIYGNCNIHGSWIELRSECYFLRLSSKFIASSYFFKDA